MTDTSLIEHGTRVTVAYDDGQRVRTWYGTVTGLTGKSGGSLILPVPGLAFDMQDMTGEGPGYRLSPSGLVLDPGTPGWTISPLDEAGQRLLAGQTAANIRRAQVLETLVTRDRTLLPVVNRLNETIDALIAEAHEAGRTGAPLPTPHGPVRPSGA